MTPPPPVTTSRRSPIIVATAANTPAMYSPCWPPADIGGHARDPRRPGAPDSDCSVNSVAARSAHGPVSPNGVIAVTVASGAAASSCSTETGAPRDHRTASIVAAHASSASTSLGRRGIDGDALLAAGQPAEQRAGAALGDRRPAGAPRPQRVAAGRLGPHDVDAARRQQVAAVRAGQRRRQVEHPERSGHR